MHEAKYPVKATRHSFEILNEIRISGECSLAELDNRLDISKSVLHNHLSTLRELGYVTAEDAQYRIGLRFLELAGDARRYNEIFVVGREPTIALAEELEEQVTLVTEEHGWGVPIYQRDGERGIDSGITTGGRIPLHCSAAGKAILAFCDTERLDSILDHRSLSRLTTNTITESGQLLEELEEIRTGEHPVAFDYSERARGVKAIAVPLNEAGQSPRGALTVALPDSRFRDEDYRETVVERLLATRAEVPDLETVSDDRPV